MPINIKDLSNYQRYLYGVIKPENLREIDFVEMSASDPFLKMVWLKCAEGVGTANYTPQDYVIPARLADAAKLGVGPYHFWHYNLNPLFQASTFWSAASAFPGTIPPLCDIEDTDLLNEIGKQTTLAAKISVAKLALGGQIWQYYSETKRLFGKAPVIYTGGWYWTILTDLLLLPRNDGTAQTNEPWPENKEIVDRYRDVYCYSACYDPRFADPVTDEYHRKLHVWNMKEAIWQYTSTPKPPIAGIHVPGMNGVLGEAVDCGKWLLSDHEFYIWSGLPETTIPPEPPPGGVVPLDEFIDLRDWAMNLGYPGFGV